MWRHILGCVRKRRGTVILEYIEAALAHAWYELIDDDEPYYGEVPGLDGVWATGKTLEECRANLKEVIDGWIIVRLRRGLAIPSIDNCTIEKIVRLDQSARA
jgi:predicted RNase H-like HicB family nuclease